MKPLQRRVIFINTTEGFCQLEEVSTLADMQKLVGGLIERAHILDNGDEVYVNEEGMLGDPREFFSIHGAHQFFAGNAFIIGAPDRNGNMCSAISKIGEVEALIRFKKGRLVENL